MASKIRKFKNRLFLAEIFKISISAFGGPEVHLALFSRRLVNEKKFFTQNELMETYSICHLLPGPSSTQTLTTLGYRFGGPTMGFLSLLVWVLPSFFIMTALSFVYIYLPPEAIHTLRYIQPLAVSFVIVAAIKMMTPLMNDRLSVWLAFYAFFVCALLRHPLEEYIKTPWIFPFVLVTGALFSYWANKESVYYPEKKIKVNWQYLLIFAFLFIVSAVIGKLTHSIYAVMFENNFRFGSLVFGGGNVLLPMIYEQFVQFKQYINADEFITAIGLVQATPGPVFAIATFTTGLALESEGAMGQLMGCIIGTAAIFLPGSLLAFWLFPVWNNLKKFRFFQRAFKGIIATSTGMVAASAYLLFLPIGLKWKEPNNFFYTNLVNNHPVNWLNVVTILVLCTLLYKLRMPSPYWVLLAVLAGIIF
ncbi:MAG: chromate transporter [Flavobacteriales bacterium]|nr:chromate transporter [Flavobacteriales bacterium]